MIGLSRLMSLPTKAADCGRIGRFMNDRLGSDTVHHFHEVDLFVVQAEVGLRFARGEQPAVRYRPAVRATELADEILSKGRERV
jgi:hypothetical protein